jgi:subtilisin family serine protease
MTTNYRKDHVLVRASEFRPGDIGRLNDVLRDANLGQLLGDPAEGPPPGAPGPMIKVPVEPGADPLVIQAAIQAARSAGQEAPAVSADPQSSAGTVLPGEFFVSGKKSGHGMGWVPSPDGELAPVAPWAEAALHPVIALLDTGVQQHAWLDASHAPFLLEADDMDGWVSPLPHDDRFPDKSPVGTHWGHGTFIAGLIRQVAPQARVLSMPIMNSAGLADDSAVINALTWLHDTDPVQPGIVLMAFGRRAIADDPTLPDVRRAVHKLIDKGWKIVASAGNDGSDQPVYPAAFAAGLPVISVGALKSDVELERYSNFGSWVRAAWIGTDIVSIHPLTITAAGDLQTSRNAIANPALPEIAESYAWWSGTSFAAAICAAQMALDQQPGLTLPLTAAQP